MNPFCHDIFKAIVKPPFAIALLRAVPARQPLVFNDDHRAATLDCLGCTNKSVLFGTLDIEIDQPALLQRQIVNAHGRNTSAALHIESAAIRLFVLLKREPDLCSAIVSEGGLEPDHVRKLRRVDSQSNEVE